MRKITTWFLSSALLLITGASAQDANPAIHPDRLPVLEELAKTLNSQHEELLRQSLQDLQAIDRLQTLKVLSAEQNTSAQKAVLANLASTTGQPLTRNEAVWLLTKCDESVIGGLFTFVNIVRVVAALLLIIAVGWLYFAYFGDLPIGLLEVGLWAGTGVLLYGGKLWPHTGMWLVMPGAFLLLVALWVTANLRLQAGVCITSGICTVVWGVAAVAYASPVLGFMTMMALETFLGFSFLVEPLCVTIGFEKEDSIPRAMLGSLAILIFYITTHVNGTPVGALAVFSTGALFMGSFVYYLGCLIISSKYYTRDNYAITQLITLVSGVAALYFGATFHLETLLGIGGTFFFLYLIEKYYELPWKDAGWAWSLLGLAGMLYGGSIFAWNHPQYFLFVGH